MATKDEIQKKLDSSFLYLDSAVYNLVAALAELKESLQSVKKLIDRS